MERAGRGPREFSEIFGRRTNGGLPMVVGGQAVNLWAIHYQRRLHAELASLLPFTSKDLDLLGDIHLLEQLHARLGGRIVYGQARSPVLGHIEMSEAGGSRIIEILRSVHGLEVHRELKSLEIESGGHSEGAGASAALAGKVG